jgi:transposase
LSWTSGLVAIRLRGMTAGKPYPSGVSDEEWLLVAPCLTLLPEQAGQREHSLREVFNRLRYVVKSGAPWRWLPNDSPPWAAVYQQTQRWLAAGCFEALAAGRKAQPTLLSWTAGPCAPRRKAARGRALTVPSGRRAPSCTWQLTRWGICWRCTSRLPSADNRAEVGRLAQAV